MFLKLSVGVVILALGAYFYTSSTPEAPPLVFGGTVHPDFQEVADIFKSNLVLGHEKGASLAFHFGGKPLVDIWGGYADIEALRPWKEDTLSIIYSSTKGVTAILVALFVDRGWLKYENLVSHYWPEFGKNGKEKITVGMLLSHQGGLSITNGTLPLTWIEEHPEKVQKFLEQQRPVWPPGTGYAYHGITFGLYVDVLLTKADPKHRRVDKIFKDEIGNVFGVEIHHGLPNSEYYRAARHVPDSMSKGLWDMIKSFDLNSFKTWRIVLNPESMFMRAMKSITYDSSASPYALNSPDLNRIPISSFIGYSNAHNLAKLYDIIANGGKTQQGTLLSKKTIGLLNQPVTGNKSLDELVNFHFGYGVIYFKNDRGEENIGHAGHGGQMAFADMTNKIGIAYVTARIKAISMGNDKEYKAYSDTFYKCFDRYLQKNKL